MDNRRIDESSFTDDDLYEAQSGGTSTTSPSSLTLDRVLWGLWWAGTLVIVLSWLKVVSNFVGWIGFSATLASVFASVVIRKYWRLPR